MWGKGDPISKAVIDKLPQAEVSLWQNLVQRKDSGWDMTRTCVCEEKPGF